MGNTYRAADKRRAQAQQALINEAITRSANLSVQLFGESGAKPLTQIVWHGVDGQLPSKLRKRVETTLRRHFTEKTTPGHNSWPWAGTEPPESPHV
jgi:hypothetical protein